MAGTGGCISFLSPCWNRDLGRASSGFRSTDYQWERQDAGSRLVLWQLEHKWGWLQSEAESSGQKKVGPTYSDPYPPRSLPSPRSSTISPNSATRDKGLKSMSLGETLASRAVIEALPASGSCCSSLGSCCLMIPLPWAELSCSAFTSVRS